MCFSPRHVFIWLMLLSFGVGIRNADQTRAENGTAKPSANADAKMDVKSTVKPDVPRTFTSVRLVLPPVIHAVPGIEANVYFDNISLLVNPENFVFDAECDRGKQQHERWTYTPTEKDIGDHALKIEVRDESNQVVAKAETVFRVVPAATGDQQSISLLCIGDSLTHASIYPAGILARCETVGNPKLELVGSHWVSPQPGPVRHEGYGGWTALRFATHFSETARTGDYAKRGSPFLYKQPDGKSTLDFQKYCQDANSGKAPTHVTIFLGPNDIFSYKDETIENGIESMLGHYDQLIEMVRKSSPTTRIGVLLPVPPAVSQDAFGSNYNSGQTRWQYKRNQHRLVERMLERYRDRESQQIELVPTHLNLDCVRNYPSDQVTANARTSSQITRQNNGVHPAESGYHQIADTVYAWLKSTVK